MAESYVQSTSTDVDTTWAPTKRVTDTTPSVVTDELKAQFTLPNKILYTQQYASIYYCRIRQLRPVLMKRVKRILEAEHLNIPICAKTVDAVPDTECVIFGTLYKDMPLKPCVLDEYDKDELDATRAELATRTNLVSPEDVLALEDEHGRVALTPAPTCRVVLAPEEWTSSDNVDAPPSELIRISDMVSGAVVAIQGKENDLGEFVVHRMFFPEAPEAKKGTKTASSIKCDMSLPAVASQLRPGARYLAFMSDLALGNPALSKPLQLSDVASSISSPQDFVPRLVLAREGETAESKGSTDNLLEGSALTPQQALDLCIDYLLGLAGSPQDAESVTARIEGIVLAGNSLYQPPMELITDVVDTVRAQKLAEVERKRIVETSTRQLDVLLAELASAMKVTLIPGARDPARHNWPQPEFHRFILPRASTFSSFESLTNPTSFSASGLLITGSDGLAVRDICRLSTMSHLDALEHTLRWRHIVPTAPDTIGCYPFDNQDPFVLRERPQIFFAGDQKTFGARRVGPKGSTTLHEQCLLLSIPSFSKTATIVLVDVDTLQAIPVSFGFTAADSLEADADKSGATKRGRR